MRQFIFLLTILLFVNLLFAQDDPCNRKTEGTDFWFGFMENRNYHNNHFVEISVTAREATNFRIYTGKEETPFNNIYTIPANSSLRINIPWELVEATGSEVIQNKGIRLVSDKPVNVYALNWDKNSSDVALIYPVESLGNEYFAVCFEPHIHETANGAFGNGRNSQFMIVASANETNVSIIPSKVTDKLVQKGDTIHITLDKGEIFQVQSLNRNNLPGQGDLTGSYIFSDKPIAFFSGSLATTVPADPNVSAWDHLYEQIPPVYSWGREYYAVPLQSREQDRYRILAAYDNTTVHIDGLNPFVINRGEYKEFTLYHYQPKKIFAEKPVLVVQYSQSQTVDKNYTGGNGDPFMIILSSVTQSKNDVTFVAYDSEQIVRYYVNVITKTNETGNILLNGDTVGNLFSPFPNSNYSYAQLALEAGTHRLQNTLPEGGFLAYVYGFGGVESYGYGVGYNLNIVLDLGKSINFEGDTLVLCYGEILTLDAGPYFNNFNWNTGDTTQTIKVTREGHYYVKASTIDGCELEDSIYIIMSHPEVDLGIDYAEGCSPYSVELDAGGPFKNYLWYNDSGDTLSTGQHYTANETEEIRLTVMDNLGCPARDTFKLVVFPVPYIEIKGPELVCGSKTIQLSVDITGAPESVWNFDGSFKWETDKAASIKFSDETHKGTIVEVNDWGHYTIYYKLETTDGCIKADTFSVRFHPKPIANFIFEDDPKCEGYSKKLIFDGEATDTADFYWDLDGCQFLDTIDWKTFIVSVGAKLDKAPYISLYINDNGCTSEPFKKELGANPVFTMEADPSFGCDELTVNFIGKLLVEDLVDFKWEFDDGTTALTQNVQKHFPQTGSYGAKLTVTNPVTQCQNSFYNDSMITILSSPVASVSADPNICYPDSILIFYPDNTNSSICQWSFDGIHQAGPGNDSIMVVMDNPTGKVILVVEESGCPSEPLEIQLKRKPHFDFLSDNPEGCQPLTTEVYAKPLDENLSFLWMNDSLPPLPGESNIYFYTDPGENDIGLIAMSSETGCTDTLIKNGWIMVHPKPEAAYEVDFSVALLENARIIFTNESSNADIYSWNFGDSHSSDSQNPTHTYTEIGEFTSQLISESVYGCLDTAQQIISILPFTLYFPTAFRPGSPIEENRTFMPVGTGADPLRFNLKIYSRNGQIVFETKSPDDYWNGNTPDGKPAPMDNYIWIARYFDIQGFNHEQKGQVLLIR